MAPSASKIEHRPCAGKYGDGDGGPLSGMTRRRLTLFPADTDGGCVRDRCQLGIRVLGRDWTTHVGVTVVLWLGPGIVDEESESGADDKVVNLAKRAQANAPGPVYDDHAGGAQQPTAPS